MSVDSPRLHPAPVKDHGGSLLAAQRMFPKAPRPWIDLSTGINPHSYPHSPLSTTALTRLPEPADADRLRDVAALAYGLQDPRTVVAAPGTQILLPMVMSLVRSGRAKVLSPTYAEHARAAALAGHRVSEVTTPEELADADLAIVVNPNNPDGRLLAREEIVELGAHMASRGGMLVVDEAFMDIGPEEASVGCEVSRLPIVVLRSFGKFYGLAGARLGFAIASAEIAGGLSDRLGPWAVSGPALTIGIEALGDGAWRMAMRQRLETESQRLDDLILQSGLTPYGGTHLFRFARGRRAGAVHRALGGAGIFVRAFEAMPNALRFGLPGDESAWARLEEALSRWTKTQE